MQNPIVIRGLGLHVEIDESMFARRKNNVGRVLPQQWVFGGVCRETRECFLVAVPDRTAQTLLAVIRQHIHPKFRTLLFYLMNEEPIVESRTWAWTWCTCSTVNHTYNFVDPVTGTHTQTIESMWNRAKERNKRHCGTHRAMLDSYLCEFMWRRRVHVRGNDVCDAILNDIVAFWPPA